MNTTFFWGGGGVELLHCLPGKDTYSVVNVQVFRKWQTNMFTYWRDCRVSERKTTPVALMTLCGLTWEGLYSEILHHP